MDRAKIEKIATSAVQNFFVNNSKQINPNIEDGDRGISFDGDVVLFNGEEFTKKGYLSKIPVQVKGTIVDTFSEESTKYYDFDRDTFKNFQLEDGVVIFLVEIIDLMPFRTKIFYKFLDTQELESILLYLNKNQNSNRVVELFEIGSDFDLDKTFKDIAIKRKTNPYIMAKMDSILSGENPENPITATFDKDINSKAKEIFSDFEYKNENSEYNKTLKKELDLVLSKAVVLDTKKLAILNKKLYDIEDIRILPKNNHDLAMLAIAKYEIMTFNFIKARATISKINIVEDSIKKQYQQLEVEANLDVNSIEEFKNILTISNALNEDEKEKLLIMYLIYHGESEDIATNFPERESYDYEWKFLYGKYLSQLGQHLEAAKKFQEVYDETLLLEIKFLELQALTVHSLNNKIANKEYVIPENLLIEGRKLQKSFGRYKNIEMPALNELVFEIEIMHNPEKEIENIERMISSNNSKFKIDWLIEWKIRIYLILDCPDRAIKYIDGLEGNQVTAQIIGLKILCLEKNSEFSQLYNYVLSILDYKMKIHHLPVSQLAIEGFLYASSNIEDLTADEFEENIQKIFDQFTPNFFNLIQLESSRKKLKSPKYGESFSDLELDFSKNYSTNKAKAIQSFIININDEDFGEKIYDIFIVNNQLMADEFYTLLLFNNARYEESLAVLSKYKNIELSSSLIAVKSEILLRNNQLRALMIMEKEIDTTDFDFLNRVLSAKIQLLDKEHVPIIVEKLLKSDDIYSKVNAAYAMVTFGLDLVKGMQMYMQSILELNFKNNEINRNYLGLNFFNSKKLKNNEVINSYDNVPLNWYKFRCGENIIEFIVLPKNWQVTRVDGVRIEHTDSDFQFEVRGIKIGDVLIFDSIKYECLEKEPLSIYILRRVSANESGDIKSDKPIKVITVDGGLEELISFMKQVDRTDNLAKIKSTSEKLHAPFFFEKFIGKDELVPFFDSLFEDENQSYYIGSEQEYSDQIAIQISVSSLIFLWNLNLLEILTEFKKIYIEKSQHNWLETLFDKEFEDTTAGKLGLYEGHLVFDEKNEEKKNRLKKMYKSIVISSRKLENNEVGIIEKKINYLVNYDDASIQAAIENDCLLLIEDEALQSCLLSEFKIETASVGTLISHYFLFLKNDIEGYLDVLLLVINKNSAWILSESNFNKVLILIMESDNPSILKKFSEWKQMYIKYFETES